MEDKQLKSLKMPGLEDRYMIQLTVKELENLIQRIEHEGGIAYKQDIFNGDYNSLSNTPDLSIYAKKTDIPTNFVTLGQLDTRTEEIKNSLIGTFNDELDGEIWTIKKVATGFYLDKTNINFISNGALFPSIEYRRGIEEEGMPIPDDEIVYGDTVVGLVSPTTDLFNTEVRWIDPNYATIKFIDEKPSGKLLEWLQLFGTIKGPDTFQGLFNYVNNQDNEILKKAKTYINNVMNDYHGPIANENTLGVVMGGGHGIGIDENGRLYATGEIIADANILWSKIVEKPTTLETISKDAMCQAIIKSLPSSSQSGNYADLLNKPDLSKYALKTDISEYTLPTASTSTLGGVKIDNSTIGISDGFIYVKNTNSAVWTKWTE